MSCLVTRVRQKKTSESAAQPPFLVAWEQSGQGRRTYFDNCVSQHLSGAGSSPAGSVGRDLNLQKLNHQYLPLALR